MLDNCPGDIRVGNNYNNIINKICKCIRLSESCNANEAAAALRQAHGLMKKYCISEDEVLAVAINESFIEAGERYNPPGWALSLSNLIAKAFQCRSLVFRRYGFRPKIHFIGMGVRAEVATYTFTILFRKLENAQEEFRKSLADETSADSVHKLEVFTQGWLFRVERTVKEFVDTEENKEIIDNYIHEKYGDPTQFKHEEIDVDNKDYDVILSGMRAANDITLFHSVEKSIFNVPRLPDTAACKHI